MQYLFASVVDRILGSLMQTNRMVRLHDCHSNTPETNVQTAMRGQLISRLFTTSRPSRTCGPAVRCMGPKIRPTIGSFYLRWHADQRAIAVHIYAQFVNSKII